MQKFSAQLDDFDIAIGDLSHLPTHCKFVGLKPQWDFLNFVAEKAKAYSGFRLRIEAAVTDLLIEDGRIAHDIDVDLRRPRNRGSAELATLEGSILRELLRGSEEQTV